MKKLLAVSLILFTAAPAFACSYAPLRARPAMSASQKAEFAADQQTIGRLLQDMNTVCATTKMAAISTCQYSKGMCDDLPFELQGKFKYDFGADGSLKGMVSPEDRTKNAETINRIYKKWNG